MDVAHKWQFVLFWIWGQTIWSFSYPTTTLRSRRRRRWRQIVFDGGKEAFRESIKCRPLCPVSNYVFYASHLFSVDNIAAAVQWWVQWRFAWGQSLFYFQWLVGIFSKIPPCRFALPIKCKERRPPLKMCHNFSIKEHRPWFCRRIGRFIFFSSRAKTLYSIHVLIV